LAAGYFREYGNKPEELFERCFGKKPDGKVQLIAGPMTLSFRCFDEEDYIYAYINYLHEDETPKHTGDERTKAKRSQGVAFAIVRVPELAGMVIMEKASNNSETIDEYKTSQVELKKNRATKIKYDDLDLTEHLNWDIDQNNFYSFSFTTNKNHEVTHVTMYDFEDGDYVFYEEPVKPAFVHKLELPGKQFRDNEYVMITVDSEGISFGDHSRKAHVIKNQKKIGEKLTIKDEKLSKSIRRHEEQHQFNKLFIPHEQAYGDPLESAAIFHHLNYLVEMMEKSNILDERLAASKKILETLTRQYRRVYIDPAARDEMIAYYKEGKNPEKIGPILMQSPLYDYKDAKIVLKGGAKTTYRQYIEDQVYKSVGAGHKKPV